MFKLFLFHENVPYNTFISCNIVHVILLNVTFFLSGSSSAMILLQVLSVKQQVQSLLLKFKLESNGKIIEANQSESAAVNKYCSHCVFNL